MKIKAGADCRFLRRELSGHMWNIEQVFLWNAREAKHVSYEFVITSGADGEHSTGSKHYDNKAIDCRVWYTKSGRLIKFDDHLCQLIAKDLRTLLGNDYDVLVEYRKDGTPSHIHIEWDS